MQIQLSKTNITVIGLVLVAIILGNFWYYMHAQKAEISTAQLSASGTEAKSEIPKATNAVAKTEESASPEVSAPTGKGGSEEENTESAPVDSASYSTLEKILDDKSWVGNQDKSNYTHFWGRENLDFSGDILDVLYPKGSNSPSNSPRGGAGFIYTYPQPYDTLALSYSIKFEDGFDFVKGGKLPGLCGGNCSRGSSMPTEKGFSVRFAWKKNGYLDTMSFLPNTTKPGAYSGEKMFKFEPGKEYAITMQLKLNDVGQQNGIMNILVDGKQVYSKNDVTFRVSPDVHISSFLFSTFFGGSDDTYSATKDSHISFGKFNISDTF